ncbi:cation transporter [Legionella pneumophila serogroup 1]|uniref:Cadmium, cobalt and zinc/H(+)-K(+) antiporter n=1 Tax=Fluoribacter dumoffii TaxID=463 RepID=A0A377GBB2_9GAMM|nr:MULTISPECIES: cation transporter [Legionellaceae]KTC92804.1 cation efflux system protein [Fluoribacter dumoffii NY 23]MDW9174423.1 cation transporter [Legionella pneumophila]SNV18410.1 cation efflux system protein [Legionella pneumophila]STO22095.1 Cadmium, cobalt and zinc/H(+)-K(+) antiporter [Fluoribacter dumoffii]HAT4425584.1 cation transporter [Legionella pneumophila]
MSCKCQQATTVTDKKVLFIALALNFIMFVVGLIAGIIAESTGLIADSLDMLADASAYALGLLAVGRGMRFKTTTAALSGSVLLILGIGVLFDVGRRVIWGSSPISTIIITIACLSLVVNGIVLYLLRRFRDGEIHLRATWIFTRADVVANLGVILSGSLIALTKTRYPDLVVGIAISLYVIKEALEILGETHKNNRENKSP